VRLKQALPDNLHGLAGSRAKLQKLPNWHFRQGQGDTTFEYDPGNAVDLDGWALQPTADDED
jgi:hypothetical protein